MSFNVGIVISVFCVIAAQIQTIFMEYPYFDWRDGVFLMAQFSLLLHIDQAVGLGGIERLYHSIRFISFGILASSFFISFVLPAFQYQSVRSL